MIKLTNSEPIVPATDEDVRSLNLALAEIEAMEKGGASIHELALAIDIAHRNARFRFKAPRWPAGIDIYRVRKVDRKPLFLDDLGYPPLEYSKVGRLNAVGESIFYGSIGDSQESGSFGNCLFECGAKLGDWFVTGWWKTTEPLIFNHFGFTDEVMARLDATRQFSSYTVRDANDVLGGILSSWQAKIFTRYVAPESEHLYRLSIALAHFGLQDIEPAPGFPARFSGIIYPSVALNLIGYNVAIRPEVADSCLTLVEARYIQVTGIWEAKEVVKAGAVGNAMMHDSAHGCDESGRLGWQTSLGSFGMRTDLG